MEELKIWLKKSVESSNHENFKNGMCTDISIEPFGHGQVSVLSDMNRVVFKLKTPNGEKIINAIAKVETTKDMGKHLADQWQVFESESMMYNEVIKTMSSLLREAGDDDFPWPDCYKCADNKILLQNLCEEGFDVVHMNVLLDYDHILHVMKAIGKFHGLSMIMNERGILDLNKIKPSFLSANQIFMDKLIQMNYGNIAKIMKESWGPDWSKPADNLLKLAENPGIQLANEIEQAKGKWNVINHGDFSKRNIMFHYPKGSTRPDGVKFVDFQMCHFNSLAYDLVSILYGSMAATVRDKHMETFLNTYLKSLNSICKAHDYKNPIPTMEDIQTCMKSIPYFATMCSVNSIGFMVAPQDSDENQKVAEEFMKNIGADGKPPEGDHKLDFMKEAFKSPQVTEFLKYEMTRLVKENII